MGRGLIFNLKSRHRHWGFRGLRETRRDKILLALNCIKLVSVSKSEREETKREEERDNFRFFFVCFSFLFTKFTFISQPQIIFTPLYRQFSICSLFLFTFSLSLGFSFDKERERKRKVGREGRTAM